MSNRLFGFSSALLLAQALNRTLVYRSDDHLACFQLERLSARGARGARRHAVVRHASGVLRRAPERVELKLSSGTPRAFPDLRALGARFGGVAGGPAAADPRRGRWGCGSAGGRARATEPATDSEAGLHLLALTQK